MKKIVILLGILTLFGCSDNIMDREIMNKMSWYCIQQMQKINIKANIYENIYCTCRAEIPIDFTPDINKNKIFMKWNFPKLNGKAREVRVTLDCHRKSTDRKFVENSNKK